MAYSPFNKQVIIEFSDTATGSPLNDISMNNFATALDMEIKTFSSEVTIDNTAHTKYLAFKDTNDGLLLSLSVDGQYRIVRVKNEQVCFDGYYATYYSTSPRYTKAINLDEKTKIFYYDGSNSSSYYWVYIITYYYDKESQTEKMLTLCSSPNNSNNLDYMHVYIDNEFIGNTQINYADILLNTTLYGENYCAMIPFKLDHLNCPYDKLYLVTNRTGFKYGTVFSLNGKQFVILSGTYCPYSTTQSTSVPMKLAVSCN